MLADRSRGIWAVTVDVDLLRRLASGGFDWLAVDAQHGPLDRAAVHAVGRALADTGASLVVRVPSVDPVWIGAALDAGAGAVVVPSVSTTADAVLAARASRYPPAGERSWGQFAPQWGGAVLDPASANAAVQCLVMIETAGALADVDAIASTPGVDGLFVGPFDLALALGTTVDALLDDRSPGSPLGEVVAAAKRHGILVAAFAGTPATPDGCGHTASTAWLSRPTGRRRRRGPRAVGVRRRHRRCGHTAPAGPDPPRGLTPAG